MERGMRRAAAEITDPGEIEEVIRAGLYLFLAVRDDPGPYLVPLCFGYLPGRFYIHCAAAGTKLDLIGKDPRVGFGLAEEPRIVPGETACGFSAKSRSVIGDGIARMVSDPEERSAALEAIMSHYGKPNPVFEPDSLKRTCVLAVDIRKLRAKRVG
jgi:nitroimidazol reductase NimA-like FMN-containing flavoprotein (pyridoxamine 5'-phosphate oxidase superfamily)